MTFDDLYDDAPRGAFHASPRQRPARHAREDDDIVSERSLRRDLKKRHARQKAFRRH